MKKKSVIIILYLLCILTSFACKKGIETKEDKVIVTSAVGDFEGCVSAEPSGTGSVDINFTMPKDTSVFYIYRDGVPIKTIANLSLTSISDSENIRPGQTYVYSCWAKIGALLFQGKKELEITMPAVLAPTFKGIHSVEETATSLSRNTNDKEVRVTWEPEADDGPRAYRYKIYALYGVKTVEEIDWNNLPTPKKEVLWPGTFSVFKVGEDMPYTFIVRACTKQVGDILEYCDLNKLILSPKRSNGLKRISDGGVPSSYSNQDLFISATQLDGKIILTIPWNDNVGGVYKREIVRKEFNNVGAVVDSRIDIKTTGSTTSFIQDPVPVTSYTDGDDVGEIKAFTKYTYQVFDYDFSDLTKKIGSNILTVGTTDLSAPEYLGLSSIEFKAGAEDTSVVLKFPKTLSEDANPELGASYYLIYKTHTSTPYEAISDPCLTTDSSKVDEIKVGINDNKIGHDSASDKDTYTVAGLESRHQYAFCVKTQDKTGNISKGAIYNGGSGTALSINGHRVVMRDKQTPFFDGVETTEILNGKVKLTWATPSNGKGGIAPDLGRYLIRFRAGANIDDSDFKIKATTIREQEILSTNTNNNISVTLDRSQQAPRCYQAATPNTSGSCEMFKDRENLIVTADICDDAGDSGGVVVGAMNFAKHDFSLYQDGKSNCTNTYDSLRSLKLGFNFLIINDITAPWPWFGISSVTPVTNVDGAVDVTFDVPKAKADRDDFGFFRLYRIISPTLDTNTGLDLPENKEAISNPIKCEDIANCTAKADPTNPNSDYANENLTHRFMGLDARRSYTFYLSAIDKELPTYNERFVNISPGVNVKEITTKDVTPPYWNGRKREDDLHDPSFSKNYDKGNVELSFNCIDDNQYKYEDGTNLNYNVYLFRVKKGSSDYYESEKFESEIYNGVTLAEFAKSGNTLTSVTTKNSGISYFSLYGDSSNIGIELLQVSKKDEIKYSPLSSYSGNGGTVKSTCSFNPDTNSVTGKITYSYKVSAYDENKNLLFAVCANDASGNFRCGSGVVGQKISDTIPPSLASIETVYLNENLPSPAAEDSASSIIRRWKLKIKAFDSSSVSISVYRAFSDTNDKKTDYPSIGSLSVNNARQIASFTQTNIPLDPNYFTPSGFDSTEDYIQSGGQVQHKVYANYLLLLSDSAGNETRKFYSVLAHYPTQVVSGDNHSCTLFNSGKIQCWGDNTFGQLGYPFLAPNANLASTHDYGYVQLGQKAKQIVSGSHHNCALMEDDSVRCWGSGVFGQLGNKRSGNANLIGKYEFPYQKPPVNVTTLGSHKVQKLFAWGTQATCAQVQNTSGTGSEWKLYCWGATFVPSVTTIPSGNTPEQTASSYSSYLLGNNYQKNILNVPTEIAKPINTERIHTMYGSLRGTCFVSSYLSTGLNIACTGYNTGSQNTLAMSLGTATSGSFTSIAGTPELLNKLTRVGSVDGTITSVELGQRHGCLLFNNGGKKFRCWGLNQEGILGNNTISGSNDQYNLTQLSWSTIHDYTTNAYNFDASGNYGVLPVTMNLLASKVDDSNATWANAQSYSSTSEIGQLFTGSDVNCITSSQGNLKCWGSSMSRTGMPTGSTGSYLIGTSNQRINNSSNYWDSLIDITRYYAHCAVPSMFPVNTPIVYSQERADSDPDYKKCFSPNQPSGTVYNVESAPYEVAINSGGQQDKVHSVSIGKYNNCAILNHGDIKCWGGVAVDTKTNKFKLAIDHKPVFDALDDANIDVTIATQSNWYEFFLIPGRDTDNQNIAAKIQSLPTQGTLQCEKNGAYADVAMGDEILPPYLCRYKVDIDLTMFSSNVNFSYGLIQLSDSDIDYLNEAYELIPSQNLLNTIKNVNLKAPTGNSIEVYKYSYKVLQVEAGASHTCALYETIKEPILTGVKCWGSNGSGQLGYGHTVNVGSDAVSGTNYTHTNTEYGTMDSVPNGAEVVSTSVNGNWFRLNEFGDVPIFWTPSASALITTRIRKIVVGSNHTCAMSDDPENPGYYQAKCWGNNSKGQLFGFSNKLDNIGDFERGDYPLNKGRTLVVKDIYAFGNSTCVVQTTTSVPRHDKLVCYGDMSIGSLQESSAGYVLTSGTIKKVALGTSHVCILNSAGAVSCMGDDTNGQLGDNNTITNSEPNTFVPVTSLSNIKDIVAGSNSNCVLGSDAQVACWGNPLTNLGSSIDYTSSTNSTGAFLSRPTGWFLPSIDKKATSLSSGANRTCAKLSGGALKCWGSNTSSLLMYPAVAFGSTDAVIQYPELMSDIKALKDSSGGIASGDGVVQVSLGGTHSCFLTSRNNMNCAGSNTNGQQAYYETSPSSSNNNRLSKNLGDIFISKVNHAPFFKRLEKPDFNIIAVKGLERKIKLVEAWDLDWDDNNTLSYSIDLPGDGDPTKTVVENSLSKCFHLNPDQGLNDIECDFKYTDGANENDTAILTYFAADGKNPSKRISKKLSITFRNDEPLYYESVISGESHTCAYMNNANRDLYCWGYNGFGQLGYGHTISTNSVENSGVFAYGPVPVLSDAEKSAYPNYKVEDVALGKDHTCALVRLTGSRFNGDAAKVRCWGRNNAGQLGQNFSIGASATEDIGDNELAFNSGWIDFSKTKIPGSSSAIYANFKPMRLEGAGDKTCALGVVTANSVNYRSIVCWGTNRNSWEPLWDTTKKTITMKNPTYEAYVSPVNSLRALDFAMSKEHLCLIEESGSDRKIKCLGYNEHGALGIDKSALESTGRPFIPALTTEYTEWIEAVKLLTNSSEKIKLNFSKDDLTARSSTGVSKDYYMAQRGSLIVAAPAKTGYIYPNTTSIDRQSFACTLLDAYPLESRPEGYVKCWGTKEFVGHKLTGSSDIGSGNTTNSTIQNGQYVELGDNGSVETASYLPRTLSIPCALRNDGLIQCWNGASASSNGVGSAFWPEVLGIRIMNFSVGSTALTKTSPTDTSIDACYVLDNYEMRCTGSSQGTQEYSKAKTYCKLSDANCSSSTAGSLVLGNSKVAVNKTSLRKNHKPYFNNTSDYQKVYSTSGNVNEVTFVIASGADYDLDDQVKIQITNETIAGCLELVNITHDQFYSVTSFPKYIKAKVKKDSQCVDLVTYDVRIKIIDKLEEFQEKLIKIEASNKKIKKVALGEAHTCVLVESDNNKVKNYVKCWGRNDYYQTGQVVTSGGSLKTGVTYNDAGNLTTALVDLPKNLNKVSVVDSINESSHYVDDIFAGGNRTCALLKDSTDESYSGLRCWGFSDTPSSVTGSFISRKSTYPFYYAQTFNAIGTYVLEKVQEGVAGATSPQSFSSLGYGTDLSQSLMLPTAIKNSGDIQITSDNNIFIKSVHVGTASVCVYYSDKTLGGDEVKCFGSNQDGRLGKGSIAASNSDFADSFTFNANPMNVNVTMSSLLYSLPITQYPYTMNYYNHSLVSATCSFTNSKKPNDFRNDLTSDKPRRKHSIEVSLFNTATKSSTNRIYAIRCIPNTENCENHTVSNETATSEDGQMSKLCLYDNFTDVDNPSWKFFNANSFNFLSQSNYTGNLLSTNFQSTRDVDSTYSDYSIYTKKPSEYSPTITSDDDDQVSSSGATLLGADAYTCLDIPSSSSDGVKNYCWGKLKSGSTFSSAIPVENDLLKTVGDYKKLAIANGSLCYVKPPFNLVECRGALENYVEIDSTYELENPRLLTTSCGVFTSAQGKDRVKCWGRQNAYTCNQSNSYCSLVNFYNNLGFSTFNRSLNQTSEIDSYGVSAKEIRESGNKDSDLYVDIIDKLKAGVYSPEVDFKLATYTPNVDLLLDESESVTSLVTNPTNQFHCAVIDNIKLRCWGANSHGQLGYGKYFADDAADRILSPAQRGDVQLFKMND